MGTSWSDVSDDELTIRLARRRLAERWCDDDIDYLVRNRDETEVAAVIDRVLG